MSVRLFNDCILVDLEPIPEKRGELFLVEDKSIHIGKVVAVGPGKYAKKKGQDGRYARIPVGVEVGQRVAFHRWHGELKQGRQLSAVFDEYFERQAGVDGHIVMLRPIDLLGVVEGDTVIDT